LKLNNFILIKFCSKDLPHSSHQCRRSPPSRFMGRRNRRSLSCRHCHHWIRRLFLRRKKIWAFCDECMKNEDDECMKKRMSFLKNYGFCAHKTEFDVGFSEFSNNMRISIVNFIFLVRLGLKGRDEEEEIKN